MVFAGVVRLPRLAAGGIAIDERCPDVTLHNPRSEGIDEMREIERVREREPRVNGYEEVFGRMTRMREQLTNGQVIIKAKDLPWEATRQGRLKYLLKPSVWERVCTPNWLLFVHDIHTSADGTTTSGQHRHQGGLGLFAIEGEGYTIVNDVRYDWKAGDFIMLPIQPGGVEHQHFANHPNSSAKWVAFVWDLYSMMTGCQLEQKKVGSLVQI